MKVVVTGTEFAGTEVERSILEPAGWKLEATDAVTPQDIVAAAVDAQALLVQYAHLDAATLAQLPSLQMISRYGTGVDNIDLDAAAQHGIVVANVPAYGGDEVALHATSLILAGLRHLPQFDRAVRSGRWHHQATGRLRAPDELTLGVLGLGRIGRVVAERAGPWFGTVVAHDLAPVDVDPAVTMVGLDQLFERSDIVSVHLPLTDDTHGIVDRARLRLLGPDGYLVNTARGALVIVDDLLAALDAGELAGAALDVLPEEPPREDHPLLRREEVVLTPHVAWYSTASEADLRRQAAQNVVDWRDGRPCNQVAGPPGGMTMAELTPDELLSTTRAVRYRLDLERPVDQTLIEECLNLAVQAPSGSNTEPWHWVVVTDAHLRAELATVYRRSFRTAAASPHFASRLFRDEPRRSDVQRRVADSATYLAEQLDRVPVLVIPCITGRPPATAAEQSGFWGSVIPAVWSFMLAARTRGLGTAFTTVHLRHEREAADILGIPYDSVTQVALIPLAHYTGDGFRPAARRPVSEVASWNGWDL